MTWSSQTIIAIKRIVSEILLIEVASVEEGTNDGEYSPPPTKRKKVEEEKFVEKFDCVAKVAVWTGRKKLKEQAKSDEEKTASDIVEEERKLTETIIKENANKIQQPLNFILILETSLAKPIYKVNVSLSCPDENSQGRFTTFCTFFQSFLRKMVPHLVK